MEDKTVEAKNKPAKESKLVGRAVDIKGGFYAGHWGVITSFDGEGYYVSGGSIGEGLEPLLNRDEFTVRKAKHTK